MNYGSLKYSLDHGRCESCDCRTCECDDSEPIMAAHQNSLDAWVNADTGKIITAEAAADLLGYRGIRHADKCKCSECEEYRNSEPEDWE